MLGCTVGTILVVMACRTRLPGSTATIMLVFCVILVVSVVVVTFLGMAFDMLKFSMLRFVCKRPSVTGVFTPFSLTNLTCTLASLA